MNLKFLSSPFRWYYICASIRFLKTPWEIYDITHFDGYIVNSKNREISEDYINYRSSHKYNR